MQKFTRPLTREIELAGERLALTLSADGIAVRPVGGRKAAHEIGWAEFVCALVRAGRDQTSPPRPEELSMAIAALKQGGRPNTSPPAGSPRSAQSGSTPTSQSGPAGHDVPSLLHRLETWLARHRKHFLEGLLPPASPADLQALQNQLGVPLPADLAALLAWHNGQSPDRLGRFEQDWLLMGTQSIAEAKKELNAGAQERTGWQTAWVPFLDNDAGDYVCLDTAQAGAPVREFWQDRQQHPVVAPSLAAWLKDMVEAVERGEYHEDPERGSFLKQSR